MAIASGDGEEYAFGIAELYTAAETRIVQRIATAVSKGLDLESLQEYQRIQLGQIQNMRKGVLADLNEANYQAASELGVRIKNAYWAGGVSALRDIGAKTPGQIPPSTLATTEALVRETLGKLRDTAPRVLRAADDAYRAIVARQTALYSAGAGFTKDTTQRTINQLLGKGITGFTDSRGRSWNLTDYSTMAVRTATGQAAINGHVDYAKSLGLTLGVIRPGPRCCDICWPWVNVPLLLEGSGPQTVQVNSEVSDEVLTITVKGSIQDARDAGWGHPNDRCNISSYIPGATDQPEAGPNGEKPGDLARHNGDTIQDIIDFRNLPPAQKVAYSNGIAGSDEADILRATSKMSMQDLRDARDSAYKQADEQRSASRLPKREPWDEAGYKAQQQQRHLERNIRYAKFEKAGAITPEAQATANRKVRDAQAAIRAHLAEHPKLKRQSAREGLGGRFGPLTGQRPESPDLPKAPTSAPKPPRQPGPTSAEKIRNAETMYGTGSKQHKEAIRRFSEPTGELPGPRTAPRAPKAAETPRSPAPTPPAAAARAQIVQPDGPVSRVTGRQEAAMMQGVGSGAHTRATASWALDNPPENTRRLYDVQREAQAEAKKHPEGSPEWVKAKQTEMDASWQIAAADYHAKAEIVRNLGGDPAHTSRPPWDAGIIKAADSSRATLADPEGSLARAEAAYLHARNDYALRQLTTAEKADANLFGPDPLRLPADIKVPKTPPVIERASGLQRVPEDAGVVTPSVNIKTARKFKDTKDAFGWASERLKTTLGTARAADVFAYSKIGSATINKVLRGDGESTDEIRRITASLKAAMQEVPEDIVVARGLGSGASLGGDGALRDAAGRVFKDDGFLSTSLASKGVGPFGSSRVQMQIKVPKGTRAVWVGDNTNFKQERELLLDAGTKIVVESAKYDAKKDSWTVIATAVQ